MHESAPTAAYARRSDTPHSPALSQSSSRSRRSSTSTSPRSSSSTTSNSSSRYSPAKPPQAEATAPVPAGTRSGLQDKARGKTSRPKTSAGGRLGGRSRLTAKGETQDTLAAIPTRIVGSAASEGD